MNAQNEDRDFVQSDWFDPFPEPHTIPAGWDTSGFFSAPQTDSVTDKDSNTDSESQQHSPAVDL